MSGVDPPATGEKPERRSTRTLMLDEMNPPRLADLLRAGGVDVSAVVESPDLLGAEDEVALAAATTQGRCLVTENVTDFALLAATTRHTGLILVPPRKFSRRPAALVTLAEAIRASVAQPIQPDEVRWL